MAMPEAEILESIIVSAMKLRSLSRVEAERQAWEWLVRTADLPALARSFDELDIEQQFWAAAALQRHQVTVAWNKRKKTVARFAMVNPPPKLRTSDLREEEIEAIRRFLAEIPQDVWDVLEPPIQISPGQKKEAEVTGYGILYA